LVLSTSCQAFLLPRMTIVQGHGIFSLGGVIARLWQPGLVLLPWAFSSAMLTAAGMWDYWARGADIDYLVLGLAAYELMIGLMEEEAEARAVVDILGRETASTNSQSVNAIPIVDG
jgi:hypothetical protein